VKLYAIPFACSLASHVALREAGLDHELAWTGLRSHALDGGSRLEDVNAKGRVAVLELDDGTRITENLAVLVAIAELAPAARLAPPAGTHARLRLLEWLSFVATEVHKQVLYPHFNHETPQAMKDHTRGLLLALLRHPDRALASAPFLLGETPSVADHYLFWTLLLVPQLGLELDGHPSLVAFRERMLGRPAVREALRIERRALAAATG
jgi:glutathione S-transferase